MVGAEPESLPHTKVRRGICLLPYTWFRRHPTKYVFRTGRSITTHFLYTAALILGLVGIEAEVTG
jgi:hypothetical protein